MRRLLRRPKNWLIFGSIIFALAICITIVIPPSDWWVEIVLIILFTFGVFSILRWVDLPLVWQLVLPSWLSGLLIANRFEALDLLTFAVSTGFIGLIALARGRV